MFPTQPKFTFSHGSLILLALLYLNPSSSHASQSTLPHIHLLANMYNLPHLHSNLYSHASIYSLPCILFPFYIEIFLLPHSPNFFLCTPILPLHPNPFTSVFHLCPFSPRIIPSTRSIFLFLFTCGKPSELLFLVHFDIFSSFLRKIASASFVKPNTPLF